MAIKSLILLYFFSGINDLSQDWCYHKGNDVGLNVSVQYAKDCENVNLPHRVLAPNTALWYSKTLTLSSDTFVLIKADDGAQVYQDGSRVLAQEGYYFGLKKAQNSVITIRVLNNAMNGGLSAVSFVNAIPSTTIISKEKKGFIAAQNLPKLPKPKDKDKMSFSFWSDSQSGWPTFAKIVEKIRLTNDDFTIGLGDFVNNGFSNEEWTKFTAQIINVSEKMPVFTLPGNHDYDGYYDDLMSKNYNEFTSTPTSKPTYYSFLMGNAYFIALDPNRNFPLAIDESQKLWLENLLKSKEFKKSRWKFLLIHQPPFAQGWEGYEGDLFIRELMTDLHMNHSIDFVLSGHNHDYERWIQKNGGHEVAYIIAGGAGGGIENKPNSSHFTMDKISKKHHFCRMVVSKNQVQLFAYDLDGNTIDEFTIKKK
jgi:predicted phosphodiesterase